MRVWQEGKGHLGLRAAGVRAAGLSGGTGNPAWSLQNPSEPLRTCGLGQSCSSFEHVGLPQDSRTHGNLDQIYSFLHLKNVLYNL